MLVTTSRKPGNRTRTFTKLFSRFFNLEYVPRGKKGLDCFPDGFIIIEEKDGNPHIIRLKKARNAQSEIFMRFNVQEMDLSTDFDGSPVFYEVKSKTISKTSFDSDRTFSMDLFSKFGAISSKTAVNFKPRKKVFLRKEKNGFIIHFTFENRNVFRLKVISINEK